MSERFTLGHIHNLPLLANVPPEQLVWLAEAFEIIQLPAQTLVFHQGQPAQGLYLLARGQARLVRLSGGEEQAVGEVHANQYVGESALFESVNEHLSLRLMTDSILLFLDRFKFQQVLLAHPEIRYNLTGNYAQLAPDAPDVFRSQRTEEQLLLRQHRHWWAFARGTILPVVLGFALLIAALFFAPSPLLRVIGLLAAFILPALWIYYVYAEWQNDFIIITDLRVIRTEKTILSFEESVSEVPIGSVHEVNYVIPPGDVFARLFNFGTVFVKTAGESGNMTLTLVPNPQQMQQMLMTDQLNYQQSADQRNRAAIASEIDKFLRPDDDQETDAQTDTPAHQPPPATGPGFLSTRYTDSRGNVVYRKHLSIWAGHIFFPLMGLIGGVVIAGLSLFVATGISLGVVGVVPGAGLFVISLIWLYWADWDWRNDMLIVGEATVRIIHRRPLWLQDNNDQFLLSQVDSVASQRGGVFNTLFNRGDVLISLVGDDNNKVFDNVPNPYGVQDELSEHRAAGLSRVDEDDRQRQREEMVRYLDVYHERQREANPNVPQQEPPPPSPPTDPTQQEPPPPSPPSPPPDRDGPRPPRIPRPRN